MDASRGPAQSIERSRFSFDWYRFDHVEFDVPDGYVPPEEFRGTISVGNAVKGADAPGCCILELNISVEPAAGEAGPSATVRAQGLFKDGEGTASDGELRDRALTDGFRELYGAIRWSVGQIAAQCGVGDCFRLPPLDSVIRGDAPAGA